MRLLAELLLPEKERGTTILQGEMMNQKVMPVPPLRGRCTYHIYCSNNNQGSTKLIKELAANRSWEILVTTTLDNLPTCECFLVYLNARVLPGLDPQTTE